MSTLPETKYPNIRKAIFEMAMANNSPEDKVVVANTLEALYVTFQADELQKMDKWIDTLDDDNLSTLIDGEEGEMMALLDNSPLDAHCATLLNELLNEAFDTVI